MFNTALNLFILIFILPRPAWSGPTHVLTEDGVTVYFEESGDEEQIKEFKKNILPATQEIISTLSTDLGTSDLSRGAEIHFYAPETYYKKFPDAAEKKIPARYLGGVIHARADNDVDLSLKKTLRHELTHLLLNQSYRKVPGWLNEGLAVYEERKISVDPVPNNIDYNTIHMSKQNGSYRPFLTLQGGGVFGRDHGTVAAGYAYTFAYVSVYELIQKSGMDSIRTLLKSISGGKETKLAFESAYPDLTFDKFEEYIFEVSKKKS